MAHAFGLFAILFATWLLLSGIFEPLILIFGGLGALAAVAISLRMDVLDREGQPIHLTWRALPYWAWLGWQVLVSSVTVTRIVLSWRPDIDPVLMRLPASQKSVVGRVTYANSITLTPGTVSCDLDDSGIEVHALTRAGMDELRAGAMDERVAWMEHTR